MRLKRPRQEDHHRFEALVGYIAPDCHGLQREAISQNEKSKVSKIKSKQTNKRSLTNGTQIHNDLVKL